MEGNGEVEGDGRDVLVLVAKHTKVPKFSDSDQICPSGCILMHPDDSLRFLSLLDRPAKSAGSRASQISSGGTMECIWPLE